MNLARALRHAVAGFALGTLTLSATAQEWPQRPVKIVVASAPGGAPDQFARYYADQLSTSLGKPVIVENKPGAAGNLAAGAVATSNDQHTLFWGFSSILTINPHVYPKAAFDPRKDLVPVASILKQATVLVVNNDFPAKTLREMVSLAKAKPGTVSYGSYGIAGYPHLVMESLGEAAGVSMVHVPYKQGALLDVIGGQIPMVAEPTATALAQIKAGKVRPLAFSGAQRLPALPDIPTFTEIYPSMSEIGAIHGIWAPASTPREVIQKLNSALNQITGMPETAQRLGSVGAQPFGGTPEQLGAAIDKEYAHWGTFIRTKNIKLE